MISLSRIPYLEIGSYPSTRSCAPTKVNKVIQTSNFFVKRKTKLLYNCTRVAIALGDTAAKEAIALYVFGQVVSALVQRIYVLDSGTKRMERKRAGEVRLVLKNISIELLLRSRVEVERHKKKIDQSKRFGPFVLEARGKFRNIAVQGNPISIFQK